MQPNAAALLYILAADGRTTITDLSDAISLVEANARRHLKGLVADGLVGRDVASAVGSVGGPTVYYFATGAGERLAAAEQVPA